MTLVLYDHGSEFNWIADIWVMRNNINARERESEHELAVAQQAKLL